MKNFSEPKRCKLNGKNGWVVYYPTETGRARKYFSNKYDAEFFSDNGNIQVQNAGFEVAGLSEESRREYLDAQKLLEPFRISLIDAIREYVNARKDLAPYRSTLPHCIKFFKRQTEIIKDSISLFDAYGEYMDSLRAQNLSERHRDSQEHRLERFIKDMGESTIVATLDARKIERWIYSLKRCEFIEDKTAEPRRNGTYPKTMQESKGELEPKSKNNYRTALRAFFSYCKNKGYVKENPIEKIKKIKEPAKEPKIYTVDELRKILNLTKAESDIRAYIAIASFAGLRRAEIVRLKWNKIELEDRTITLDGEIVKTSQRRIVNISDNLLAWLAPYATKTNTTELVVESNFQDRLEDFIAKNKITWKNNALRHSCASYFLALCGDENKTATQMGHNVRILKTHYKGLVKEKDAKQYFNIFPDGSKIIDATKLLNAKTA